MNALAPARLSVAPMCEGADCTDMWQRAQLWVANHSKWKIQTATDVLIETFNPIGYQPSYGFSVTREPLGNGRYRISMALHCGNPLGCDPKATDVLAAFNYYVASGRDVLAGIGNLSGIR